MELLLKFIKFGIVGFSGLIIDFGLTFLLKEKFRVQKYVANGIGFCSAATSNYFLNRLWTFRSSNPEIASEFTDFFIVSMFGLGINSLVLWLLNAKFRLPFYLSKLIAVVVTMFWNFMANYLYTFAS